VLYKSGRSICKYQGPGITPCGLTLFCLYMCVYRWSEGGRALLCYFFPALPFGSFGVVWPGVQNSVKMQFFIGHAREPLFCSPYCLNKRRKKAGASVSQQRVYSLWRNIGSCCSFHPIFHFSHNQALFILTVPLLAFFSSYTRFRHCLGCWHSWKSGGTTLHPRLYACTITSFTQNQIEG
jgi:hypothetical protein